MSNYITQQGLEELKKELDYLKTVKTREIAELIRKTASFGDLKENFAYHDAKEKQAFLQGKILELRERINSAKIIEKKQSDKIGVGSKVLISLNGEEEKIEIVGAGQADPLKGKISCDSPLGKAIMDKSLNEETKVRIGENTLNCKILKIE
jgi:transcription elongation factor GreA